MVHLIGTEERGERVEKKSHPPGDTGKKFVAQNFRFSVSNLNRIELKKSFRSSVYLSIIILGTKRKDFTNNKVNYMILITGFRSSNQACCE
ncbi:hypothetical protein RIR_jg42197.t1 [Rhizophagus irregularis DAOM 181602=DAOM 197198]|nr:hypothetical protein RIR_jg42197.t1 [Rhizophagus irregularis DAOM 181602=DAOM 197198]